MNIAIDNTDNTEVVEAVEIISELLTHPHPDWRRIAALSERIQLIAERLAD